MLELIKKSLLTGLGLAVVTKSKLEALLDKLVAEGKMSREEAGKFLDELLQSGEKQWQDMEEKIATTVKETITNLDLCRKEDLQSLSKRLKGLEAHLADLEKRINPASQG